MKIIKPASEMDQEGIFSTLPQEIILEILSRIPIETVLTCKCVYKPWLNLLGTPEFAKRHLSNSAPGLLIFGVDDADLNVYRIFEFEDPPQTQSHVHHYKPALELNTSNLFASASSTQIIYGCANGLISFRTPNHEDYCIYNPITDECLRIPIVEEMKSNDREVVACGFGASRHGSQHKIVRITQERRTDGGSNVISSISEPFWHIFSVEMSSWMSLKMPEEAVLDYKSSSSVGTLLDGKLHWLAKDSNQDLWVASIDLETDGFIKSTAPMVTVKSRADLATIGVVRGRICFCDSSSETEIVIYVMNECGDGKMRTWAKEYAMAKIHEFSYGPLDAVFVVKAFRDGDLLMMWGDSFLFRYSSGTKDLAIFNALFEDGAIYSAAILYTPSFISIKSLIA